MSRWAFATVIWVAAPVFGQVAAHSVSPSGAPMRPVDQLVEDTDPHAVSARRVEPGLAVDRPRTSALYVETLPADLVHRPQYWRVGPGFRARVDRIDYVTIDRDDPGTRRNPHYVLNQMPWVEGEYAEKIGPNTVFELTTPGQSPIYRVPTRERIPVTDYAAAPEVDPRIDGRLDTLIDGRVHARLDGELMHAPAESFNLRSAPQAPADSRPVEP